MRDAPANVLRLAAEGRRHVVGGTVFGIPIDPDNPLHLLAVIGGLACEVEQHRARKEPCTK